MRGTILPFPPYVFMAWCFINDIYEFKRNSGTSKYTGRWQNKGYLTTCTAYNESKKFLTLLTVTRKSIMSKTEQRLNMATPERVLKLIPNKADVHFETYHNVIET